MTSSNTEKAASLDFIRARTTFKDHFFPQLRKDVLQESGPQSALGDAHTLWAEREDRPLVLLIDEIDTLEGDGLISMLRQLRAGYPRRPAHFPQSVVLCGIRDGCGRVRPSFRSSTRRRGR